MTVLIAMAGRGQRFTDAGYAVPKYRIRANGRSLLEWSLLSMQDFFDDLFVFACLGGEDKHWIASTAKALGIADVAFHERTEVSAGQAQTVFDARSMYALDAPLWIYNIDTYVASGMHPNQMDGFSGCIPVFNSKSPNMSFVAYDDDGKVSRLAEKQPISAWATVGLYGFRSAADYDRIYQSAMVEWKSNCSYGELYVAPLYNLLLSEGAKLCAPKLNSNDVHILGTPAQLANFDPRALPPLGSIADQGSID